MDEKKPGFFALLWEDLGPVSKKEALAEGLTHHASYYGLPLYIGRWHTDCPTITPTWGVLWPILTVFEVIEATIDAVFMQEPGFSYRILGPIEIEEDRR